MAEAASGNIKTIFFDAGGVLFVTKRKRMERIGQILRARGYSEAQIAGGFAKAEEFYQEYRRSNRWISTWDEEDTYWHRYYGSIACTVNPRDWDLDQELFHLTHYARHCEVFPEVPGVLEQLASQYELAVISNALPSLDWVFDLLDLRKYFKGIFLSAKIGVSKPDAKIFQYALQQMDVAPEKALYIDDKLEHVVAAQNLGINGFHLQRSETDLTALLRR